MSYKKEFINFLLKNNALKFGEFTLKSGRISPYFINTGLFNDGKSISKLGYFYAAAINELNSDANIIFGPAYKGIPLSITTSIALNNDFNKNINYSFNRKEEKDHGDKGVLVGTQIDENSKIIIIDDVITSGKALRESFNLLKQFNPKIEYIIIAVDRMEQGPNGISAIKEIEQEFKIKVKPIITIKDIMENIQDRNTKTKIQEYLNQYGAKE